MLTNLQWKEIPVFKIRHPGEKFSGLHIPPEEYLFDRFRIGDDEKELFTEEAALHLSLIHPIIVWSSKNYCISGIRTLLILSSVIPATKITVGVLPSSLTENEVQRMILADAWLTGLAFSTKHPEASLFEAKERTPKTIFQALSPALAIKVADFAKALGVSTPSLYKLRKRGKKAKPR